MEPIKNNKQTQQPNQKQKQQTKRLLDNPGQKQQEMGRIRIQ
jgi:hypothetical protein